MDCIAAYFCFSFSDSNLRLCRYYTCPPGDLSVQATLHALVFVLFFQLQTLGFTSDHSLCFL